MENFLPLVLLAVFGVLLFTQSRNRKKAAATLAASLEPGAEVVLTSGVYATVDAIADDRLMVTTAGVTKLEVARGAVLRVSKSAAEVAASAKPASKTPARAAAARTATKSASTATKKAAPKGVK